MWPAKCQHASNVDCHHHLLPNFLQCCLSQWQSDADIPHTHCMASQMQTMYRRTYVCVMLMSLPLLPGNQFNHMVALTAAVTSTTRCGMTTSNNFYNFPHSHHHSATTFNYCQWPLNSQHQHLQISKLYGSLEFHSNCSILISNLKNNRGEHS